MGRTIATAAVAGPLIAQFVAISLARLQKLFCPANFLPAFFSSLLFLAPLFLLISLTGAKAAARLNARGWAMWQMLPLLLAGGAWAGWLYWLALTSFLGGALASSYTMLLTLPSFGPGLAVGAAIAASWTILTRRPEPCSLNLRP